MAEVWLPLDGQVVARLPASRTNRSWLRETVHIRSPHYEKSRWFLPRNCLVRLVTAGVDRYDYMVVWREMSKLSRCNTLCLRATGLICDCSCMGAYHGQDSNNWFERYGDVVVADMGEVKLTAVIYGSKQSTGRPRFYEGELHGRQYTLAKAERLDWPFASQFVCTGCATERASVWDHCHTHGFVRAPLCNTCNTRTWSGWDAEHGRARPSSNLDTSYYDWCPRRHIPHLDPCSV